MGISAHNAMNFQIINCNVSEGNGKCFILNAVTWEDTVYHCYLSQSQEQAKGVGQGSLEDARLSNAR